MKNLDEELSNLLSLIEKRIRHKAKLYDGLDSTLVNSEAKIGRFVFSIAEELGEVTSALTRERYLLAKDECIDVAHSALLLYLAIENFLDEK